MHAIKLQDSLIPYSFPVDNSGIWMAGGLTKKFEDCAGFARLRITSALAQTYSMENRGL
jgi:hypothetical protein